MVDFRLKKTRRLALASPSPIDARQHCFHRMDIQPRCSNMGGDIIVKERS